MTRKAALLLFLLLASWNIFAQQQKITGKVTDAATGELLIGVNIIYGSGKGTITDINGNYVLKLDQGEYTLEISYVGYEKQSRTISVKDKTLYIDFSLKNITLSEVEVIGDIARTRETPVAFSNIPPLKIEEELASQDLPMILNRRPGSMRPKKAAVMAIRGSTSVDSASGMWRFCLTVSRSMTWKTVGFTGQTGSASIW